MQICAAAVTGTLLCSTYGSQNLAAVAVEPRDELQGMIGVKAWNPNLLQCCH
jgi:hypothetical protein